MPWQFLFLPSRSPVSVSQTVGVLSLAAEKSRSPSRLKSTRVMFRSWPFMTMTRCDCLIGRGVGKREGRVGGQGEGGRTYHLSCVGWWSTLL